VRRSNHSLPRVVASALIITLSLRPPPRRSISNFTSAYPSIIPLKTYGKTHKDGPTVLYRLYLLDPRFARLLARNSLSERNSRYPSAASCLKVASENIYSWIEQLNPTMNVLRASLRPLGMVYASEIKVCMKSVPRFYLFGRYSHL
jgi:hypothetical protein